MKKILSLAFLSVVSFVTLAQSDTTYWSKGGNTGINFNQSTLTNWAAGGASSVSGGGYFNVFFDYKRDRVKWLTSLELGYGLIQESGEDRRKTDDKIILTSSYGYQLSASDKKWYLTTLLDFRTQFDKGFDFDADTLVYISKFMAPAYLLTTVGIEWKPAPYFSAGFGPISGKFTFVNDQRLADEGAFGVDPGKQLRVELGGTFTAKFDKEVAPNVTLTSKALLFSNYIKNPEKIDVNWENTLNMKVNEFLNVNIFTQLIYDYDVKFDDLDESGNVIGQKDLVQFKSILGIGIGYKFGASRG